MLWLSIGVRPHKPTTPPAAGQPEAATTGRARRCRRALGVGHVAVGLVLAALAAYACLIEPDRLEVTHHELPSAKVSRPLTIVVVADFQANRIGKYERRVLRTVAKQNADVILFAGDQIQEYDAARRKRLHEEFRAAYREAGIAARHGVYAVKGNVDSPDWEDLFAGLDVRTFSRTETLDVAGVRLTGLVRNSSRDVDFRLRDDGERFHIVFGHHPDYALGDVQADVLLAGHTHGGQVQLPFIGPLLTLTRVPRKWAAGGRTDLGEGRTLIISRGTGVERGSAPRIRFLCRPELVVLHLLPA